MGSSTRFIPQGQGWVDECGAAMGRRKVTRRDSGRPVRLKTAFGTSMAGRAASGARQQRDTGAGRVTTGQGARARRVICKVMCHGCVCCASKCSVHARGGKGGGQPGLPALALRLTAGSLPALCAERIAPHAARNKWHVHAGERQGRLQLLHGAQNQGKTCATVELAQQCEREVGGQVLRGG